MLQQIRAKESLITDINSILYKNGINETINYEDVTKDEKTVSDLAKINARLSDAIINHLWPSIESKCVYHYTCRKKAESILNKNSFRLTNISKRYNDGEIKTFCETHDLKGYLKEGKDGNPEYKSLMSNTYYASFTDISLTKEQEQYFWTNFASPDGVRLKIEIKSENHDFRKIYYEQTKGQPIQVLYDLIKCIREKHSREFVLKGMSRLCSFYLSGEDYENENEFRMLYRVWNSSGPQPIVSDKSSFIELPLGTMSECGFKLNITEVCAFEKPNMPETYFFSKRKA